LNAHGFRPFFSKVRGTTVSGPILIELIRAVHEKGGTFRFRAAGFSMFPVIQDGDRVLIEPLGGSEPVIGDIAAFIQPDTASLAIHRIIGINGDAYLLKGDNTLEADGYVPRTDILGLVRVVERTGWNRLLNVLRKARGHVCSMGGKGS
jgi:phage repressor protein C with HTH and peptisase S24 domain